jgi:hypothetical protein
MRRYITKEFVGEEIEHLEVVTKLDRLDALRPKVAFGFAVFWGIWLVALVYAIINLFW